jgi:hypothetical protein
MISRSASKSMKNQNKIQLANRSVPPSKIIYHYFTIKTDPDLAFYHYSDQSYNNKHPATVHFPDIFHPIEFYNQYFRK